MAGGVKNRLVIILAGLQHFLRTGLIPILATDYRLYTIVSYRPLGVPFRTLFISAKIVAFMKESKLSDPQKETLFHTDKKLI